MFSRDVSGDLYHRKLEELAHKAGERAFSKSKSEWYCTAEKQQMWQILLRKEK